jgi:hypothetical protein
MVSQAVSPAAWRISALAFLGAALASGVTLFTDVAYPPPPSAPLHNGILAEARGWSLVTLLWVVPLGLFTLERARAGSRRARVAWGGVMAYLVYTFLELAVSGPFTPLFLVYTGTLGLSVVGLTMALGPIEVRTLASAFGRTAARRAVGVFALVVAIGLTLAWSKGIVLRMVGGEYGWPDAYGSVAQVVHALDLGLQVPLAVAAGALLLRDRPAGALVGGVFAVMAATMFPALTAMVTASGLDSGEGIAPAIPFAIGSCIALALAGAFFGLLPGRERNRVSVSA